MLAAYDQENLTTTHATNAAAKPLNHRSQTLHPRTPGQNLSRIARSHNDENSVINTATSGKARIQNAFITPAPQKRAPLGAKPTNTRAKNFQTPSVFAKSERVRGSSPAVALPRPAAVGTSTTRRSAKRKIYVQPGQDVASTIETADDDIEPEVDSAPPPIIPIPDPPIDFDYDQTFPWAQAGNFNRGAGPLYFGSPRDENGESVSEGLLRRTQQEALEQDLRKILLESVPEPPLDMEEEEAAITDSLRSREHGFKHQNTTIDTLRAKQASSALSRLYDEPRSRPGKLAATSQAKLSSACTAHTVASRAKQKPIQTLSRNRCGIVPPSVGKNTIGFPRARRPAPITSIFPRYGVQECEMESELARPSELKQLSLNHGGSHQGGEDGGVSGSSQESAFGRIDEEDETDIDEELQFKINGLDGEDFEL